MSHVIAIDGFSACGKSTLARAMAKRLNYRFIDTGAMYRMITLHFLRNEVSLEDEGAVAGALEGLRVDFLPGSNDAILNGENVETEIRGRAVSDFVSPVAAVAAVRRWVVPQQQAMGKAGGIVMDGRDIGTVVFPDADLKLFITADRETRIQRRIQELIAKGIPADPEAIANNLDERDRIDSTRQDSPLRKADDAIEIDNSSLSLQEFIEVGMAEAAKI
ncbi:(d)CMP kinase [Neolewinella agarilytica]|uniref:Cytidylate kinase n=1 Tax=Neolewinella agarilytica TaxID=478744 RepID=A0A1H9MEG5_9BACT|nr:(d)CMP kinase [Neolewinella agarilytica]SER21563.1 cytidylate kinase [Neolewinella agarilytica]